MAHMYSANDLVNIDLDKTSEIAAKSEDLSPGDLEEARIDSQVHEQTLMGEDLHLYNVTFTGIDLSIGGIREDDIAGLVS